MAVIEWRQLGGRRSKREQDGGRFTSHDNGQQASCTSHYKDERQVVVCSIRRGNGSNSWRLVRCFWCRVRCNHDDDQEFMADQQKTKTSRKQGSYSLFLKASYWYFVSSTFPRFKRRQKQGGANTWKVGVVALLFVIRAHHPLGLCEQAGMAHDSFRPKNEKTNFLV